MRGDLNKNFMDLFIYEYQKKIYILTNQISCEWWWKKIKIYIKNVRNEKYYLIWNNIILKSKYVLK